MSPQSVALIVAVVLTLLLGGIPFGLGKYIELNSPDPFDGGAYAYSAQRLLNGARLWVDEFASARPGTLLCNVLGVKLFGFSDFGPNVIQMLLQIGGLIMVFYAVRRLFGNAAAAVSTTLAAIMLSAPVIAKFGNVKEQFMIPFAMVAACAFALHETGGKKRWAVIAGAASIIPYYFKPTGIAIVAAIGLYLAARLIFDRQQWKAVFTTVALWVAGAVVGLCVPAILYIWQKDIGRFFGTFPVILVEGIIVFTAVAFGLCAAVHYTPRRRFWAVLRGKEGKVWMRAALLIALVAIASAVIVALPILYNQAETIVIRSGLFSKGGYVDLARQMRPFTEQSPQVFRYYHAVGAVVYPALATLLLLVVAGLRRRVKKQTTGGPLHAVAALWAVWWVIDMALVWVSAHSYEQYYLPLCASGAMLFAYAVWMWRKWLTHSTNKLPSLAVAGISGLAVFVLIVPVFAGFAKSPDTGVEYKHFQTGQPERRRGFTQSLNTVRAPITAPWQSIGDHIRNHSSPDDTLYVWGWFPGIYVQAQRIAPVPRAYEADMHVSPPDQLARKIDELVNALENTPPRFIVDSLKRHFPFDRPPLELWPVVKPNMLANPQPRLLRNDPREIEAFENAYAAMLEQQFDKNEALRFEAMKPFRDFVMTHYRFAGQFGSHILFEQKD